MMRFSDGTICDYCGNTVLTALGFEHRINGNVFCCLECADDYDKLKMKPKLIDGKWHIETYTEEFGNVLLIDRSSPLPIPVAFDCKEYAWEYILELADE